MDSSQEEDSAGGLHQANEDEHAPSFIELLPRLQLQSLGVIPVNLSRGMGDAGLAAVTSLTSLCLNSALLTNCDLSRLSGLTNLSSLQVLSVLSTPLMPLLESLPGLQELCLNDTIGSIRGSGEFRDLPHLVSSTLTKLCISSCDCDALPDIRNLPTLRQLHVDRLRLYFSDHYQASSIAALQLRQQWMRKKGSEKDMCRPKKGRVHKKRKCFIPKRSGCAQMVTRNTRGYLLPEALADRLLVKVSQPASKKRNKG
eukprot:848480-Pelagomonas_calceolata.AAC.1